MTSAGAGLHAAQPVRLLLFLLLGRRPEPLAVLRRGQHDEVPALAEPGARSAAGVVEDRLQHVTRHRSFRVVAANHAAATDDLRELHAAMLPARPPDGTMGPMPRDRRTGGTAGGSTPRSGRPTSFSATDPWGTCGRSAGRRRPPPQLPLRAVGRVHLPALLRPDPRAERPRRLPVHACRQRRPGRPRHDRARRDHRDRPLGPHRPPLRRGRLQHLGPLPGQGHRLGPARAPRRHRRRSSAWSSSPPRSSRRTAACSTSSRRRGTRSTTTSRTAWSRCRSTSGRPSSRTPSGWPGSTAPSR